MNLSEMVDHFADNQPDHPAVVFEDKVISYAELLRSVNRLANALVKAGVQKGDRVALLLANRPEFVLGYFAAVRVGAVAVTLNPASTSYELSKYFADCRPKVVMCREGEVAKIHALETKADYIEKIFCVEPTEDTVTFAEVDRDFSDSFQGKDMQPDDPAVVIFTAGLLGRAYGATLSHRNLDSNSNLLRDVCRRGPESRGLAVIPMFHAFGAAVNLLTCLKVGGAVYLVDKLDFSKLVPWLNAAQCTFAGMVPMLCYGLTFHPACKTLDLSSLEISISGGAALSKTIYDAFTQRFNIPLYHGYGLTEAAPVVSWNNINIPNKPSTVGKPIPDEVIEIHDDNGQPLPTGATGEVVVKGPNVMIGYLGRPMETQRVIRNGWLYTGDLGHLDTDGYLTLTGLKKDLIITAGFNVYCQEVEEIVIRHAKVADVALRGVDDLMRGQVIEALIVPEPGTRPEERDIIRFCREYLSRYKCPRKVTFVNEIIRDDRGKAIRWS